MTWRKTLKLGTFSVYEPVLLRNIVFFQSRIEAETANHQLVVCRLELEIFRGRNWIAICGAPFSSLDFLQLNSLFGFGGFLFDFQRRLISSQDHMHFKDGI